MSSRVAHRAAESVTALRNRSDMPVDADRRGPVQLDRFFQSVNLTHVSIAELSTESAINYLVAERYVSGPQVLTDLPATADRIDGFLFWAGDDGLAFVNADKDSPLPRRRFTAAHELGHAVMHRDRMDRFRVDAKINDGADSPDEMEREANQFAVELLMPADVCRIRAAELRDQFGCCPRGVLAYRIAAELLVSREAMRYRLADLEVGDDQS